MRISERAWVLSVCLLTLIHRYRPNRNCFRFRGYLWISLSKQTDKMAGTSCSGTFISWWVSFISCCWPCFYIILHAACELNCSNDLRDKQGVLKLMVGARGPLCTIYRVTWYLWLLALSILTCSPNISFLARLVSDNFGNSEKWSWRHYPPQPPLRKLSARGPSSCSWLPVHQIWPS